MMRLCENRIASAIPDTAASTNASTVILSVVHSDAISEGKSAISAFQIADGAGSTNCGTA